MTDSKRDRQQRYRKHKRHTRLCRCRSVQHDRGFGVFVVNFRFWAPSRSIPSISDRVRRSSGGVQNSGGSDL